MKFGKILQHSLRGLEEWPSVHYTQLKKQIEQRTTTPLFATGAFKKALRDDILAINAHWQKMELALRVAGDNIADHEIATAHMNAIRRAFKWLTLNYLAVLKIVKKHDKNRSTALLEPISMVLLTQPFVKGLTSSPLFAQLESKGSVSSGEESKGDVLGSCSSMHELSPQAMIISLLGQGSKHYFPEVMRERMAAADLRIDSTDLNALTESDDADDTAPHDSYTNDAQLVGSDTCRTRPQSLMSCVLRDGPCGKMQLFGLFTRQEAITIGGLLLSSAALLGLALLNVNVL